MVDLVRQDVVNAAHTVVIKIGTNVLARPDGGLDQAHLAHLAEQIAEIHKGGRRVVIVSSGAIGAGMGILGKSSRPTELPELQAAAALGQSHLIQSYDACLAKHGFHAAQILLTGEDFNDRTRYLNVRNTILQLLRWNAVPVINENDTVSVQEIKFGDNDRLAALVTNLLRAPLLIILSVVDGLYPADSAIGTDQPPIDKVLTIDEEVFSLAGPSTSKLGTGGMRSKLESARIATAAGENVWIANGRKSNILLQVMRGESVGTLMVAHGESLASWKRWIGFTVRPRGSYVVDDGAMAALKERNKSLLPIGVVDVKGDFKPGDVVSVETTTGVIFARGLSNYAATEAKQIIRKPTSALAELLPGARYEEVIHRDNLVIL